MLPNFCEESLQSRVLIGTEGGIGTCGGKEEKEEKEGTRMIGKERKEKKRKGKRRKWKDDQ